MSAAVYRISTGSIHCKRSILIRGGSPDETQLISCNAWLVLSGGMKVLVDTGIDDLTAANANKSSADCWHLGSRDMHVTAALEMYGILPGDIDRVYLTHSHYDHISAVGRFINAEIVISSAEYKYLQSGANPHDACLDNVKSCLKAAAADGRLKLIDVNGNELSDCIVVGGHTPGSMMIRAEDALFTGDAVFLRENIERNLPIGFSCNEREAENALKICSEHSGAVYTGHDTN